MNDDGPRLRRNRKEKLWFNWPLVGGLILNFLILGLIGSCIARSLK